VKPTPRDSRFVHPQVRPVVPRARRKGQVQHRALPGVCRLARLLPAWLVAAGTGRQPQARPRTHDADWDIHPEMISHTWVINNRPAATEKRHLARRRLGHYGLFRPAQRQVNPESWVSNECSGLLQGLRECEIGFVWLCFLRRRRRDYCHKLLA